MTNDVHVGVLLIDKNRLLERFRNLPLMDLTFHFYYHVTNYAHHVHTQSHYCDKHLN